MHKDLYRVFYFVDCFNKEELNKLNKKISIIYRNYKKKIDISEIEKIAIFCKKNKIKFYLSNHPNLAFKMRLDGVYLPSFNLSLNVKKYKNFKNFEILGSGHNIREFQKKQAQGVKYLFLSPLFKTKKSNNYLDIHKFNNLRKLINVKVIALGGINQNNYKKMRLINCFGMASISYIKISPKINDLLKIENGFKNRI